MAKQPDKGDLVVLSSIEWSFLWQRHQELATKFAGSGWNVVFIESSAKRNPKPSDLIRIFKRVLSFSGAGAAPAGPGTAHSRVGVISPLVLPSTAMLFRSINRLLWLPLLAKKVRKALSGSGPLLFWCYLPTQTSLDLIEMFAPDLVVYDCVTSFSNMGKDAPKDILKTEETLLKNADAVFTDSEALYEDKSPLRPDIVRMPPGVDYRLFEKAASDNPDPKKICYFGSIDERIDFGIIEALAGAGYEVEMIGPVRVRTPRLPESVRFTGAVPISGLPEHLRDASCIVIPYHVNEFTKRIMPAKIFECLATGKPVVTTPMPDLVKLAGSALTVADSPEGFVSAVRSAQKGDSAELRRLRQEMALSNSWDSRFERILEVLDEKRGKNA